MSLPVTVGSVIYRIRSKVYGAQRMELDVLSASVTVGQTSLGVTYGTTSLAPGAVMSVGTELMYVANYAPSTKIVDVIRGWNGSKAVAWGAGTELEINARFPTPNILNELRDEIAAWPQSLYRVVSANQTVAAYPGAVRLDPELDGIYGIIDIRRSPDSSFGTNWPRVLSAEIVHDMDAADFSTGVMLAINDCLSSSTVLRVVAAMPFATDVIFATTTDLINEVGLAPSMVDLAILGTAIRLVMPEEIKRSSRAAADEPRIAAEVPPGLAIQTGTGLVRQYERRLMTESAKLASRYPIRFG